MNELSKELRKEVNSKTAWFKSGGQGRMSPMMMDEVEMQFIEMAQGGDGTCTQQGNIRKNHYEGKPDQFFQAICNELGWKW